MKSITEFPNYILVKGIEAKTALTAEGKTPEEIQEKIGADFRFEGDRLKHLISAIEVASQNTQNLGRVKVMSLNEGEVAPPRSLKVEEFYYVPEFRGEIRLDAGRPDDKGGRGKGGRPGGRGGGRGQGGGPKESPWGLSPEQKAAKKGLGKGAGAGTSKG